MTGTLINVGAVILGSLIGIFLNRRLPEKITAIAFQGIGLFTIFLGISMALKTHNYLIMIFSVVIGAISGEILSIEAGMDKFGNYLKKKLGSGNGKFSEGMITAFLIFCMGSMTVLGAIEEGLGGKPNLLLAKSLLDGFASLALASAMGIGVIFSIIPLLIYQGGLTLFASFFGNYFPETVITELTAVGGIILIGLGIRILEIKQLRVLNMLPALFFAVVLSLIFL